ncbi:FkbM family methyltransferase [Pseudothermotoga sp.]|nr:FkbM family methyltransferase [Pseudothermotoga sp.]MDW8140634.1 FkbM family methyltransferase [Pseudothermotoga sp.]
MNVMDKLAWRARYVLSGLKHYPRSFLDKDFWSVVFSTFERYKRLSFSLQFLLKPLVDKLLKHFFSLAGFFELPIDYYGQRFTLKIFSNSEDTHFEVTGLLIDFVFPYFESDSKKLIQAELDEILAHSFPGMAWEFPGSEFFNSQTQSSNRKGFVNVSREFFGLYFYPKIKRQFWLNEGRYDNEQSKINRGDVVFDLGAHVGIFTCLAGLIVGDEGKVYAFEPLKEYAEILKKNVELNRLNNVTIVQKAVGDQERSASMKGISVTEEEGEIPLITLDRFVQENSIDRIDFLKMDVEGYERKVLLGGMNSLKKFKPKMGICIYHLPDDPAVIRELVLKINPNYRVEYNETGKKFIVY